MTLPPLAAEISLGGLLKTRHTRARARAVGRRPAMYGESCPMGGTAVYGEGRPRPTPSRHTRTHARPASYTGIIG